MVTGDSGLNHKRRGARNVTQNGENAAEGKSVLQGSRFVKYLEGPLLPFSSVALLGSNSHSLISAPPLTPKMVPHPSADPAPAAPTAPTPALSVPRTRPPSPRLRAPTRLRRTRPRMEMISRVFCPRAQRHLTVSRSLALRSRLVW